jgi:hypothetical protein
MTHNEENNEEKEEFCSLCVSAGLAVAGAGGVNYSTRKKGTTERNRNISLFFGILGVIGSIYFYYRYTKECKNGGKSECE